MAGHHSNEAMIEQIQASDHWGYYQAKGIKAAVLGTRISILGRAWARKRPPKDAEEA